MSQLLVRFARRLTSWEPETSDEDLLRAEFWDRDRGQPNLRPSTYLIEIKDLVQAYSEHATAFDPPSSAGGIDFAGTNQRAEVTPGDTGFPFTMEAHRELVIDSEEHLLNLIREVRSSLTERLHVVSRSEVGEYVRQRLRYEDEHWERARSLETAHKWLKKIR